MRKQSWTLTRSASADTDFALNHVRIHVRLRKRERQMRFHRGSTRSLQKRRVDRASPLHTLELVEIAVHHTSSANKRQ